MSIAPVLPISLTPLVCIFQSKELSDVLSDKSLPLLHQILQTFSPLQQGQYFDAFKRIYFSQLENACKEDEDERASRIVDWIGQRITREADKWVKSVESDKNGVANHPSDTPWWRELQLCVEGDSVPTRFEGWNHPVAVILAVSTLAPNPLQAVTELHSRYKDVALPSWVDPTRLCHTLIIHPTESPLNSDEATALYNAIKKQYGLHTHLLPVTLEHPPKPISLPSPLPELPPFSIANSTFFSDEPWDLNLTEADIQQLGRFVREFVTMSLVPWMERCVLDWNESYIAARKLPSRFFTTTKRLFGGSSTPTTASSPGSHSPISINGFSSMTSSSSSLPHHRRLAEFATVLGDTKLAIAVWETLRKDGRNGSEVLPFLLTPTPTLTAHAVSALAMLQTVEFKSSHQLQALCYAIRWASGIQEFESLGGERWLEMAAGSIEEPPFALLLGQAALLSSRKGASRKAAMWYAFAAHRLEKCGVVGVNHFFGDIEGALQYFINLLKGSSSSNTAEYNMTDSVYVGDFKVAYEHLKSSFDGKSIDLTPPFKLSQPTGCSLRFGQDQPKAVSPVWESFELAWDKFWKIKGNERLDMERKASVGGKNWLERFYVDIILTNPFDVSITLGFVTLQIETTGESQQVEKELLDEIVLEPRETRMISLYAICHHTGTIKVTHLTYNFLSLLHVSESLAVRGPRLNQSVAQQRDVEYGPNTYPTIQIQRNRRRLDLSLDRSSTSLRKFVLGAGECAETKITLHNVGPGGIDDIWILHSPSMWLNLNITATYFLTQAVDSKPLRIPDNDNVEIFQSDNALTNLVPVLVPLETFKKFPVLEEGDSFDIPCMIHASQVTTQDLYIMAIFRQHNQKSFFSSKLHQTLQINPILECGVVACPSHKSDVSYETMSPLLGLQFGRLFFLVKPSGDIEKSLIVDDMAIHRLRGVLLGEPLDPSPFPSTDVLFSHMSKSEASIHAPGYLELLHSSWRTYMNDTLLYRFREFFPDSFDKILPLWSHRRMNIVLSWEIPEENRRGFVTIPGITLGACHAPLEEAIHNSAASSTKRAIYAETTREKAVIQNIIQSSDWNTEMNPLVVRVSTRSPQIAHDFSHGQNMAPCYIGALTRRGSLKPRESATVQVKMWVTRPGIYGLDGWKLETEVGGREQEPWLIRASYVQEVEPDEGNVVIIVDNS
ncbi:hypothetical protein Clacol_008176 [Clathrus columnatus]|uniref:Uncharacterized protein n=1 Tax=Clathrus columnatus TaxID=1419009 RepID=A0AAV5AH06_9AGAM|nr:hypothetical protein Clacol_008176 [Clathrus columnatus]